MNDNHEFDRVLDDALTEYREVQPLTGLENRVLERVRLQVRQQPRLGWQWGAVVACAALLAIAVWDGIQNRVHHDVAPTAPMARTDTPRIDANTPARRKLTQHDALAARRITSRQLPRSESQTARKLPPPEPSIAGHRSVRLGPGLASFPVPTSLSPEERSLLALARLHPEALPAQLQAGNEIAIAPLEIEPLPDTAVETEGEN